MANDMVEKQLKRRRSEALMKLIPRDMRGEALPLVLDPSRLSAYKAGQIKRGRGEEVPGALLGAAEMAQMLESAYGDRYQDPTGAATLPDPTLTQKYFTGAPRDVASPTSAEVESVIGGYQMPEGQEAIQYINDPDVQDILGITPYSLGQLDPEAQSRQFLEQQAAGRDDQRRRRLQQRAFREEQAFKEPNPWKALSPSQIQKKRELNARLGYEETEEDRRLIEEAISGWGR